MTSPNRAAGTAVVPLQTQAKPVMDFASIALNVWSSFGDAPESRAKIVRLMQGQAEPLSEHIGEIIPVEHVLAHRVDSVDSTTGEVLTLDRIVLVTPDGEAFQCVSEGIKRSILLLTGLYGMPPWKPALPVKLEAIKTRRGFTTFTLNPAE